MVKLNFPSIPPTTAAKFVTQWLDIIKRRECAIIIYPPKGDAYRRILHLFVWKNLLRKKLGRFYKSYLFKTCSMLDNNQDTSSILTNLFCLIEPKFNQKIENSAVFMDLIKPYFTKYSSITFFLYDIDCWFLKARKDVFIALSTIAEFNPKIQFLLFCETDITVPPNLSIGLGNTTLGQNILIHPYYTDADMDYFIRDIGRFSGTKIPKLIRRTIIKTVGPHTWLIKEATRIYIREGKKMNPNFLVYPSLKIKLEVIWNILTTDQQNALLKILHKKTDFTNAERRAILHLTNVGFLKNQMLDYEFSLPIFKKYLEEKMFDFDLLTNIKGDIFRDEENVTSYFGEKERRGIVTLLRNRGNIVSREDIAKAIWLSRTDNYSDWALDRIISRIRLKIQKLGISPSRLKTFKKIGFLWS